MITEFELPEEIKTETYDSILAKMLAAVPDKYDKTEASFIFDMIAPSALEAAELIQMWLPLAIKTNFHMWATGIWLDRHAHDCGLSRKPATCAYGDVHVTTTKSVKFAAGFVFSVPSENGEAAIDFETVTTTTITGSGTLRVKAVLPGLIGNVGADSIQIMKNPVGGVLTITNDATSGGVEAESDDDLRKRIDDFYAGRSSSFVGNAADYVRWSLQVAGVGYAHCIPCYAGANSVKIVIADNEGKPAVAERCAEVERYIFGTSHADLERLAPIGVTDYLVAPFNLYDITLSMNATLSVSADLVEKNIRDNFAVFFKDLCDDDLNFGVLRYVDVAAILARTDGLTDFNNLKINGTVGNISFSVDELPRLTTIRFES